MRNLMGWRFIIAIAVPILLASLGVTSLTTDLLDRVSANADRAESSRNRDIVQQGLKAAEFDLGQLARQNAQWDEAAANIYPTINKHWFDTTWGSINSIGKSYDIVAVVDRDNTLMLGGLASHQVPNRDAAAYLGSMHDFLFDNLRLDRTKAAVLTSFAFTTGGPAVIAVSPIVPADPVVTRPRYLLVIRILDGDFLARIHASGSLHNLQIGPVKGRSDEVLVVNNLAGQPAFAVTWKDRSVGTTATAEVRQKANMVLGFLILVMGGIVFVCWRLIQNILSNEERALHQAVHDHLTELPNRVAMVEKLKSMHESRSASYAVAYADLDGFKEINDSFGHQVGDRLLRAVGAGVARLASKSTMACRMGGDEFVVLFEGAKAQAMASEFASHLLRFLVRPFDIDGRIASVGASVGVALFDSQDPDELEILRRADIAMYKAKAAGRNRTCVYDPSFDVERSEGQAIVAELIGIIERKTLDIVFQPVISAQNMKVSGVEALARWPRGSKRSVTPDRFVTIAESAGLIDDLGELVLDKACSAAAAWPDIRLTVNISAVQLNNPRFVERALAIIESHHIPTRRIEFEITETSLIRDSARVKQVFRELQRHGIKIALDDFGTGFSSIGYLRTFSFDRIKIDKSIVSKVLSNPAELAIVQGILLVARGLSAEVTAEGVELDEEAAVLKLAGCTELQGYHFHKPMPAIEVTALLEGARSLSNLRTAG